MPGGARQQLTFFQEPVYGGLFHPEGADYVVYAKDVGGAEWYQFFRYDLATGESALLTDGKSRNTSLRWSSGGSQIAYFSTRRNNQDTDLWVMNPSDPKTDHMLTQLAGGGWEPQDWSPNDKKILLMEGISINETYLWVVDTKTGEKTELTPRKTEVQVAYGSARFSKDGKGVYVTTDKDSEFQRLAYIDLATKKMKIVTPDLSWDVDERSRRLLFIGRKHGKSRALDDQRDGREYFGTSRRGAGALEDVRWEGHIGFSIPAAGEVHGQAARADRNSRRAGGTMAAWVSWVRELFPKRAGQSHPATVRTQAHGR